MKTPAICEKCGEYKILTRGYCTTKCYSLLMKKKILQKIEKPQSPKLITKIQEEILIGSLLGDGGLYKYYNSKFPYFSIGRKQTDFKYLKYEYEFFKEFCNKEISLTNQFDKRTNKIYYTCKFATRPSEILSLYYEQWYNNKKKILPQNLTLTPLICAIWFCDDGCVTIHSKTNRLKLKLSTHCFTKEENERLVQILHLMFKEHFSITQDNDCYYIISADGGTKKFIKYIENDIPISMHRKITWTPEHFKQTKSPTHLKNRDKLDLNEKEIKILKSLINKPLTPSGVAQSINWYKPDKSSQCRTPSGLQLYLKRFLEYKWIYKTGTPHSYKDTIKYHLTKEGLNISNIL